jgi:hypothetical protein
MNLTPYHAKYIAHELTRRCASDSVEKLTAVLSDAQVDLNPHQIEAALFAFRNPLSRGAILADEVGLGKTIEAGLLIAQSSAEGKRRILVIVPANLRKQWSQELADKFFLPSVILEARTFNEAIRAGNLNPFQQNAVIICSYHFVRKMEPYVRQTRWDLVVIDEAHRLRNVYKPTNKIANAIKQSVAPFRKVLLTATPLQNSLLELYGLVSIIDDFAFGDLKTYRTRFHSAGQRERLQRLEGAAQANLQTDLAQAGAGIRQIHEPPCVGAGIRAHPEEQRLYDVVSDYLQQPTLYALPASQRSLMTLILRKLLASSTYAISDTLSGLAYKLETAAAQAEKVDAPPDQLADNWEEIDVWPGKAECFKTIKLCNEVFGEENFVATILWQKVFAPKNTARQFSEDHDYILCYARNTSSWIPVLLPRSETAKERYGNPDNDPRGPWSSSDLTARNYYAEGQYEVTSKTGKVFKPAVGNYWRVKRSKFEELDRDRRIWWGDNGGSMPRLKRFLSEVKEGVVPQTLWKFEDVGHTQESKKELIAYVKFENTDNVIDSVKPTRLIKKLLKIATQPTGNDIVIDFFLGTGTTAHAVLALNAEDGGNRRFIGIQLPEPLIVPEPGLKTIADVARRRVSQVAAELSKQSREALQFENKAATELGFRLYRLDQSNFTTWDAAIQHDAAKLERQLELHIEHIRDGRTDDDILYELLLKSGYPLTVPVEQQSLAGTTVYSIAGGPFIICLERRLTSELIRAIAERKPERVVLLDEGFARNDQLKANAVQIFKTKGITSFKTV